MRLITGLCFSTVLRAWEGEVDGGSFYYTLSSANELGQTGGGVQVVHGTMEREGKAHNSACVQRQQLVASSS